MESGFILFLFSSLRPFFLASFLLLRVLASCSVLSPAGVLLPTRTAHEVVARFPAGLDFEGDWSCLLRRQHAPALGAPMFRFAVLASPCMCIYAIARVYVLAEYFCLVYGMRLLAYRFDVDDGFMCTISGIYVIITDAESGHQRNRLVAPGR